MMWPFKWKLPACTYTWCYLFSKLSQHEIWKFGQNLHLAEFGSERVKQQHMTTWNGNKRHKDGLNTDRDMAYSSKREATTLKYRLSYPTPHFPKRASSISLTLSYEWVGIFSSSTLTNNPSHSVDHLQPTFAWSVIINSNHWQKYFWAKSTFFLISFLKT